MHTHSAVHSWIKVKMRKEQFLTETNNWKAKLCIVPKLWWDSCFHVLMFPLKATECAHVKLKPISDFLYELIIHFPHLIDIYRLLCKNSRDLCNKHTHTIICTCIRKPTKTKWITMLKKEYEIIILRTSHGMHKNGKI